MTFTNGSAPLVFSSLTSPEIVMAFDCANTESMKKLFRSKKTRPD
jgi:hypothetical protein